MSAAPHRPEADACPAMEGWRALLFGDALAGAEAELHAAFAGADALAPKYGRLQDRAYLRLVLQALLARVRRVFLPAGGEHSLFRYFAMLGIQSMTVLAGPESVPSHVYALVFDRLDAVARHARAPREEDHLAFTIKDLSTALVQARGDSRALRDDLAAARRDGAAAREEGHVLRAQNTELVDRLLEAARAARPNPYI